GSLDRPAPGHRPDLGRTQRSDVRPGVRRGHEPGQLLLLRQAGPGDERRAAHRARGKPAHLPDRRAAGGQGQHPGAQGLPDPDRRGGAVSALAMMIRAPFAAMLIQLAISRSREYQADATGAEITGNPYGLARALQKIDQWSKRVPMQVSPSMAHMFICQPLTTGEIFTSLFSTHPPIPKRIERLIGRDRV